MKIEEIFKKCEILTMSKRADYTTNPEKDNYENFKRSSELASWFSEDSDKSYIVLIGTKLARLGSLLSSERAPNNESISDTFEDLINYCALWYERRSEFQESSRAGKILPIDYESENQLRNGSWEMDPLFYKQLHPSITKLLEKLRGLSITQAEADYIQVVINTCVKK